MYATAGLLANEISEISPSQKISIPRHPEGGAESLNAAVATGIICAAFQLGNA